MRDMTTRGRHALSGWAASLCRPSSPCSSSLAKTSFMCVDLLLLTDAASQMTPKLLTGPRRYSMLDRIALLACTAAASSSATEDGVCWPMLAVAAAGCCSAPLQDGASRDHAESLPESLRRPEGSLPRPPPSPPRSGSKPKRSVPLLP